MVRYCCSKHKFFKNNFDWRAMLGAFKIIEPFITSLSVRGTKKLPALLGICVVRGLPH